MTLTQTQGSGTVQGALWGAAAEDWASLMEPQGQGLSTPCSRAAASRQARKCSTSAAAAASLRGSSPPVAAT